MAQLVKAALEIVACLITIMAFLFSEHHNIRFPEVPCDTMRADVEECRNDQ